MVCMKKSNYSVGSIPRGIFARNCEAAEQLPKKILLSKEIFADFTWGHRKKECFLICILYKNTQ